MATKTEKYELRKPEQNNFFDVNDISDNMEKIETALTEFDDSGTAEGVTSFPEMLTKLVTGNKLAVTLKNLKAGLQFVLHVGSIVNNCVTDNPNLPLSAAQGKALQDQLATLNSNLGWSDTISLGKNGCGITLNYRYNTGMKLCEIIWDGIINETITVNTSGYAWEGFPIDKSPKGNVFIPVVPIPGLCIRWYPIAADGVGNKFTLVSLKENVSSAYCCGRHIYYYG